MAYVDLNPVRAQMADTPEDSDHTSIKQRIQHARDGTIPPCLMRFQGDEHRDNLAGIPFVLEHYVELVDWTGKTTRLNKRGAIDSRLPPILNRLGIEEDTWLTISLEFEKSFRQWVGSAEAIQRATRNVGKTRSRSPPIRAA